jgi:2-oxopent-4-enoate/cis-2-oxohex-4-enoate hydratase
VNDDVIARRAGELYAALRSQRTVQPLTERNPNITIEDAYWISRQLLALRLADGEEVIGKKIGVTSKVVQRALDVHQPDYGYLTDRMQYEDGSEVPIGRRLIQPRAEGEIALLLGHDLVGPGVGPDDVVRATERVMPCIEVVDSRIHNWRIRIQDTVADNASSGLFVVGRASRVPSGFDFFSCGMVVEKNDEVLSTGAGAAALGSPLVCVAWLANTLGAFGVPLYAGELVLSGSLVPLEPVRPGDRIRVTVGGLGSAEVRFT